MTVLKAESLLTTGGAQSTFSRLASQDAKGTTSATYPGATTANNLLICTIVGDTVNTAPTLSGWTVAGSQAFSSTHSLSIAYRIASGSETTVTPSIASGTVAATHIYEYATPYVTTPVDVAFASNSTATGHTSWSTPNITTNEAADLIFGAVGVPSSNGGGVSWSAGLNLRQSDTRLIDGDLIPGVIETGLVSTAAWTTSRASAGAIIAFKANRTSTTTGLTININPTITAAFQNALLTEDWLGAPIFNVGPITGLSNPSIPAWGDFFGTTNSTSFATGPFIRFNGSYNQPSNLEFTDGPSYQGMQLWAGSGVPTRTDTATVSLGSATVSDTSIVSADSGAYVAGPGIPQNTFATGVITDGNATNVSDGDTVVLSPNTYRFKNTMNQINDIQIGANADASLTNLVLAVNGTGTPGTNYFTGTVVNPWATASTVASHATTITAVWYGTFGDTIALTTTASSLTITGTSGGTLSGGLYNCYVGTVVNGTSFKLSSSSSSQIDVLATGNGATATVWRTVGGNDGGFSIEGDLYINRTGSLGSYIYQCTAAGTPGTWQSVF